jgi:hypothetical protein
MGGIRVSHTFRGRLPINLQTTRYGPAPVQSEQNEFPVVAGYQLIGYLTRYPLWNGLVAAIMQGTNPVSLFPICLSGILLMMKPCQTL